MSSGNAEGGKGPYFWVPGEEADGEDIGDKPKKPESVGKLQHGLYVKAKLEPEFRFYALYDKVYRPDVLRYAWALVENNHGAPGVDGVTVGGFAVGVEKRLDQLGKDLREKTYRPSAVRRVMIPKAGGGERPLGIPTVVDRVAQTAAKLVLEPIFEADFLDEAHGYRPERSALRAVKETHRGLMSGRTHVVDADLSKYFDTIPHDALMKSVARRVSDGAMLHLIKLWLEVPVEETDEHGRRGMKGNTGCGTPQGGVISPLLANIYMHRFLRAWHLHDRPAAVRGRLVNYADDFVILCPSRPEAEAALEWTRRVMTAIGLTINEAKTRLCDARRERFKFLGYELGLCWSRRTGNPYLDVTPAKQAIQRIKAAIAALLRHGDMSELPKIVGRLNRRLRGWRGYFSYGDLQRSYRAINVYVYERVQAFLQRRHKVRTRGTRRFPWELIFGKIGVLELRAPRRGTVTT